MAGKLLLGLTIISYLALIGINLYKPKGTGDQLMGWGFIIMIVLAAYAICTLLLTINLTVTGKLDWITSSSGMKYLLIILGWLSLTAATLYPTMINADWQNMSNANWLGILFVRFGGIWIALLLLIPCIIMLIPEWQQTISPNLVKYLLLAGILIGLFFHFMSHERLGNLFKDQAVQDTLKYEKEMDLIRQDTSTIGLLYYTIKGTDPRLTQAALEKLKAKGNFESELQTMLNQCDENYDYLRVIAYLEKNMVNQPDSFVAPLNKTIYRVSEEVKYRLQSFGDEKPFLELLNVDGICHLLDNQFRPYREQFKTNMMKMQTELEAEPKPQFAEIRDRYKAAVQLWLDEQ